MKHRRRLNPTEEQERRAAVPAGEEVAEALAGTGLVVDMSPRPTHIAEIETSRGVIEVPVMKAPHYHERRGRRSNPSSPLDDFIVGCRQAVEATSQLTLMSKDTSSTRQLGEAISSDERGSRGVYQTTKTTEIVARSTGEFQYNRWEQLSLKSTAISLRKDALMEYRNSLYREARAAGSTPDPADVAAAEADWEVANALESATRAKYSRASGAAGGDFDRLKCDTPIDLREVLEAVFGGVLQAREELVGPVTREGKKTYELWAVASPIKGLWFERRGDMPEPLWIDRGSIYTYNNMGMRSTRGTLTKAEQQANLAILASLAR